MAFVLTWLEGKAVEYLTTAINSAGQVTASVAENASNRIQAGGEMAGLAVSDYICGKASYLTNYGGKVREATAAQSGSGNKKIAVRPAATSPVKKASTTKSIATKTVVPKASSNASKLASTKTVKTDSAATTIKPHTTKKVAANAGKVKISAASRPR